MYLKNTRTFYDGAGQHAGRAPFLLLVQDKARPCGPDNFRALVRSVALSQLGNFMMGRARVFGRTVIVSGSYGHDGLPIDVESDIFARAVPVPRALYDAWNKGGGWNSAGNEAAAMRKWALKTFNI